MRGLPLLAFILVAQPGYAQDSIYARKSISYLTSKKCFGRGYVRKGLYNAEKFIVGEIVKQNADPLFPRSYVQPFHHSVNTFPGRCKVKLNGRKLVPGEDYILDPANPNVSGRYVLEKKDSVTFFSSQNDPPLEIRLKKKLTYGVSLDRKNYCVIELDRQRISEEPKEVKVKIESRMLPYFESRNIGCYLG